MITVNDLMELYYDKKVELYTDAWARGYVSRKTNGYITKYSGKYGEGFIWHKPTYQSTQYHIIEYYIFTDNRMKGKRIRK